MSQVGVVSLQRRLQQQLSLACQTGARPRARQTGTRHHLHLHVRLNQPGRPLLHLHQLVHLYQHGTLPHQHPLQNLVYQLQTLRPKWKKQFAWQSKTPSKLLSKIPSLNRQSLENKNWLTQRQIVKPSTKWSVLNSLQTLVLYSKRTRMRLIGSNRNDYRQKDLQKNKIVVTPLESLN